MIIETATQVSGPNATPRPRPPARRTVQPATAWDDVDRTLLSTLEDRDLKLETITAVTGWSPILVKDQLIAYATRSLVTKNPQTGRYELTSAGRNRLAALRERRQNGATGALAAPGAVVPPVGSTARGSAVLGVSAS